MAIEEFVWSLVAPTGFRTASYANRAAYITDIEDGKVQDPRIGGLRLLKPTGVAKPPVTISAAPAAVGGAPAYDLAIVNIKGGTPATGFTNASFLFEDGTTVKQAGNTLTRTFPKDGPSIVRMILDDGRTAHVTVDVVGNAPMAPILEMDPSITGNPVVGQTLTCNRGEWTGYPAPTYSYQWLRNGSNIASATNATYVLVTADAGAVISCRVTATNASGSLSATTPPTASVTQAPANTVAPAISGTAQVGQTLTCSTGTWTGTPAPTFAFQWLKGGAAISGATGAAYVPVAGDVGGVITCRVTGTNSVSSVPVVTAPTAAVIA